MKNKKKGIFIIIIVFMAFIIIGFQYKNNMKLSIQPPSEKWGKGKYLATVLPVTDPKIIKEGKDYVLAIGNEKSLKLMKVDSLGNILKERNIKIDTEKIRNINLGRLNNNNYYIEALCIYGMDYIYEIDKDFKIIKTDKMSGVMEQAQADERIFIRGFEEGVEVLDLSSGGTQKIKAEMPINLGAVKYKNKYIVTFMDGKNLIKEQKYFSYENGKISDVKKIFQMPVMMFFKNPEVSMCDDGRYLHFIAIYDSKKGQEYRKYTFDLENPPKKEELKWTNLKFPEFISVTRIKPVGYAEGKASFFIEGLRQFGFKKEYEDMGEFTLKGENVSPVTMISKSYSYTTYNCGIDDIVIYSDFTPKSKGDYNVYFTSSSNKFKQLNNDIQSGERKTAILDTIEGGVYAILYILLVGSRWMIPALVYIGILSFMQYKMKTKIVNAFFGIGLIITTGLKILTMYRTSYKRFGCYLPDVLSNPKVGIVLNLVISVVCYLYVYQVYKETDGEALPVVKYFPIAITDALITLLIFTPYLPG